MALIARNLATVVPAHAGEHPQSAHLLPHAMDDFEGANFIPGTGKGNIRMLCRPLGIVFYNQILSPSMEAASLFFGGRGGV